MGPGTELDGQTLVIPMRFQRRGGRKRIVAPEGSAIVPTTEPQLAASDASRPVCHDHLLCSSGGRMCRKRASSARS
jgi:hypothetical protein